VVKVSEIKALKECNLHGSAAVSVNKLSSLFSTVRSSITWVNPSSMIDWNNIQLKTDMIVIARNLPPAEFMQNQNLDQVVFALCKDPKKVFSNCMTELIETDVISQGKWYDCERRGGINIHSSAIVNCDIDKTKIRNIYIGPNVFLSEFVTIADNVKIGAGTVIGGDGFGFFNDADRQSIRMPHVSGVDIGANVEIGANTVIDRGTVSPTVIENDSKIGNLVHIGHNVNIGQNTKIIQQSSICGSVKIEENVWVGGNSVIRDTVIVGKNSVIGVGSTVTKNVPPNETWAGNPAKKIK